MGNSKPSIWVLILLLTTSCAGIVYGQSDQNTRSSNGDSQALVVVDGHRTITQKDVDELVGSQIYSLQQRIYSLRKNAIENLLTRILLEEEAKAKGISVELKQELLPDKADIKQSKIDEVYAENAGSLDNMSEDEAKQRIRMDLESRERIAAYKAHLAEIKRKAHIEIFLPEPVPPVVRVDDSGPSKGPREAAITIIEFSDFQCPYCRQAAKTLKQLLESYPNNVRLVFKQLPLPIHADAFKAAEASLCADRQGKFWEYHDLLFASAEASAESLTKYAASIGLRLEEFSACLDSGVTRTSILKNIEQARKADIQATPTFILNGNVLRGVKSFDDFKKLIDQEIEASSKGPSRAAK